MMIPMYRLWWHGLYGRGCLLSPERPLNLITHLSATHPLIKSVLCYKQNFTNIVKLCNQTGMIYLAYTIVVWPQAKQWLWVYVSFTVIGRWSVNITSWWSYNVIIQPLVYHFVYVFYITGYQYILSFLQEWKLFLFSALMIWCYVIWSFTVDKGGPKWKAWLQSKQSMNGYNIDSDNTVRSYLC